jgi:alpha-tubulin suppressor-like RCC1 family protein
MVRTALSIGIRTLSRCGLLVFALVSLQDCYDPRAITCAVSCGPEGLCPEDMECSNGLCASKGRSCAPAASTSLQVAAGGLHACALRPDGRVACWGDNGYGQLGQGDTKNRGERPGPIASIDFGGVRRARSIATGDLHSCALFDDARIRCWGSNQAGQLGVGDTENRGDDPGETQALPAVELGSDSPPIAVDAGGRHTCALLESGRIKCWGANDLGQLGSGDREARGLAPGQMGAALPAVDLGTGAVAVSLSLGADHSCALLATGDVKCWGINESEQLGIAGADPHGDQPQELGDALAAVALEPPQAAASVAAGMRHSCALLQDLRLECWGDNSAGQLGVGRQGYIPFYELEHVELRQAGAIAARAVTAGANHTCALLTTGAVTCWGINAFGALGQGHAAGFQAGPTVEEPLVTVDLGRDGESALRALDLSAGVDFTCAVLEDESIKCWGANGSGQLGLGTAADTGVGDAPAELGDALPTVNFE